MTNVSLFLMLLLVPLTIATKEVAGSYFPSLDDTEKAPFASWLDDHFSTYAKHSFLPSSADPGDGAAIFWKIEGDDIQFAVAVKASGWVGFGISEAGGMLGADIVTFTPSNPSELVDSYVLESKAAPLADDCQNWLLLSSEMENGWIILEMKRALDTGDSQDHKLSNDKDPWVASTKLIAAWGDSPNVGFHGLNRARIAVRLFDDSESNLPSAERLESSLLAEAGGFFEVREDRHVIARRATTYHNVCKTADEIKAEIGLNNQEKLTIIGAMPVLTPETAQFVHHFTVYSQKDCSSAFLFDKSMVYAWAPGDEGWALPSDVGFPFFEKENQQALFVEIHYNNPGRISDQIDSSGIRFYYSETVRTYDAAVLELGDPLVNKAGESIARDLTRYEFQCPGACSSYFLEGSEVTVLAEYLHMHQTGVRMTNEVIRETEVVHEAKVDVFEFDQQGAFKVKQDPYQVKSGDSFKTSCYYRDGSRFGPGSEDEMCIAYVMYYPAKTLDLGDGSIPWVCPYGIPHVTLACSQSDSDTSLANEAELGRIFGTPGDQCNDTVIDDETPEIPSFGETGLCFSVDTTVELSDGRSVPMKDLRLGDSVLVSSGTYEPIYGFGHYDITTTTLNNNNDQKPALFVRIRTSEKKILELTPNHLVFVKNNKNLNPVPAASLHVGEELLTLSSSKEVVVSIQTVWRHDGAVAPFTPSGTIVTNGIQSSCFATLQKDNQIVLGGGVGLPIITYHDLGLIFESPRRLLCQFMINCYRYETYNNQGMSHWVEWPMNMYSWLLQQRIWISGPSFVTAFGAFGLLYVVEKMVKTTTITLLLVVLVPLLIRMASSSGSSRSSIRTKKRKNMSVAVVDY